MLKFLSLEKKNVVVNNVEGLFEVDKQGTNRTVVIKSLHPLMLDRN